MCLMIMLDRALHNKKLKDIRTWQKWIMIVSTDITCQWWANLLNVTCLFGYMYMKDVYWTGDTETRFQLTLTQIGYELLWDTCELTLFPIIFYMLEWHKQS